MAPPATYHVTFCSFPSNHFIHVHLSAANCQCLRIATSSLIMFYSLHISSPSLYRSHCPISLCLPVILTFCFSRMAKKKRTAAQFFDDAETNCLESLVKVNINSDKVSKHLEPGTEINYNRMLALWDE